MTMRCRRENTIGGRSLPVEGDYIAESPARRHGTFGITRERLRTLFLSQRRPNDGKTESSRIFDLHELCGCGLFRLFCKTV